MLAGHLSRCIACHAAFRTAAALSLQSIVQCAGPSVLHIENFDYWEAQRFVNIVIFSNLALHRQTFLSDSPSTLPLLLASYPSCPSCLAHGLLPCNIHCAHRHPWWSASNLFILGHHCSDWCVSTSSVHKKNLQSQNAIIVSHICVRAYIYFPLLPTIPFEHSVHTPITCLSANYILGATNQQLKKTPPSKATFTTFLNYLNNRTYHSLPFF